MRYFFCLCFALSGLAAEKPAPKAPPKPAATTAAGLPAGLPAGAKEVTENLYSYTDAQGKKWLYRRTPFGFQKSEDPPAAQPVRESAATKRALESITAVEDGDNIRFERPGPFGTEKWTKKKTELTAPEQAAWDRQRQKTASAKPEQK